MEGMNGCKGYVVFHCPSRLDDQANAKRCIHKSYEFAVCKVDRLFNFAHKFVHIFRMKLFC